MAKKPDTSKPRARRKGAFTALLAELAHAPERAELVLRRGQKLGRYKLQKKLGAGATATVFQARDSELGREVALKILTQELAEGAVDRFRREARALGAVTHDNVVGVYDVGVADGRAFLALELARGGTLAQRMAAGRLSSEEIFAIARQLCSGLGTLHAAGLVHRDLKPDNVLMFEQAVVKIADFGLVRLLSPSRSMGQERTQTGALLGTVHYMSPEQVRGEPADARSDVFSLGALLFEMVTGGRPFPARTAAEAMSAILRDPPAANSGESDPRQRALLDVILRCLEKRPEDRWSGTTALWEALDRAWHGQALSALAQVVLEQPVSTRYARSGEVHVAYQCIGDGADQIIGIPPLTSNIEVMWESPEASRFVRKLGALGRYIHFDKRGTGMSDPVPPVPLADRVDDLVAVMDAERVPRAFIGGVSEGGPMCLLFALRHPERTRGLVLINSFARLTPAPDYPWGRSRADFEAMTDVWASRWGTPDTLTARFFFASRADDRDFVTRWVNRYERQCNSPGTLKTLMHMILDIDVRAALSRIELPTLIIHRKDDPAVPVEHGRFLAQHIRGAQYVELAGADHAPWEGDQDSIVRLVAQFIAENS